MTRIRIIITTLIFLLLILNNECLSQNKDRDSWQKPEAIMDTIGVKEGMVIGEAGAGEGYFTFKLSKRVGKTGKIYANDISEKALRAIKRRCEREGINNITTILGKQDDPLFPEGKLDMVVMMMAFHEFKNQINWLQNVKPSMKTNATLIIIERDPEKWSSGRSHFMTKEKILKTVKKADYILLRMETFLPKDNIYIFRPSNKNSAQEL